jgi:hypothetical protein
MNRIRYALIGVAMFVAIPRTTLAQTWVFLPDGTIGVNTSYSVSGIFACNTRHSYAGYSCTGDGNTLALTSGTATLDVTFTGVSANILARNVIDVVPLGTFGTELGGTGPFVFPASPHNDAGELFRMTLALSNGALGTPPVARFFGESTSTSETDWDPPFFFGAYSQQQQPAGYTYNGLAYSIVYTQGHGIRLDGATGSTLLQAQVGLIPEPSTTILLATGLVVVLGVAWRKRRR